jgi:predicted Zn-dependent protease
LLFSLFLYKPYLSANHDLYKAAYNLQHGQCVPAAAANLHGLETFPADFMLRGYLAEIYTACSFPAKQKFDLMNRILDADPSILRARLTRAILLNEAGRPGLAVPEFMAVATNLPHRPTAYAGLGDAARMQGELDKARFYYRAAIKRNPDYKYAIRRLNELNSPEK